MNNISEKIYFNFSYSMLSLLGHQMYNNPWVAISELVANGIDAKGTNVKIYMNLINQKSATIEIMDNGTGMEYDDLVNKYAFIGRNKRDEESDFNVKTSQMGRKGVGKLAALYLSEKYFLVSKTKNMKSSWCLDVEHAKKSNKPRLERVYNKSDIDIECQSEWDSFNTGTLIKLTNVDMTNFGDMTLEGLKARIADYYLLDMMPIKIEFACLFKNSRKKQFEVLEKKVAFRNFCGFIDTMEEKNKLLSKTVTMKSVFPEVQNKKRDVTVLSPLDFNIKGTKKFMTKDNMEKELAYELTGWIGLHASINKEIAEKNDSAFLKNKAYIPNQLRLYVRNKLSVENCLKYLGNTQAFSNYIEGEISFDILEHDDLPDIATSNRQDFIESDERVHLLKELLKPIVGKLIRERVKIGKQISEEEKKIRKVAEELAKKADAERKKAEEKEQEAKKKQKEAEEKEQEAKKKQKKAESEKQEVEKKNAILENQVDLTKRIIQRDEPKRQKLLEHELYGISANIKEIIADFLKKMSEIEKQKFQLELIDLQREAEKMNAVKDVVLRVDINTENESNTIDLKAYIRSYIENVPQRNLTCKIQYNDDEQDVRIVRKVNIFEIGIILDNLINNAKQARATKIHIFLRDDKLHVASDTGKSMTDEIRDNMFELAYTTKDKGTGLGLYIVKQIIDDYGWEINMDYDKDKVIFIIEF